MGRPVGGMFVTDLDGTLLRSDRSLADGDLAALDRLGDAGVSRVIATGRVPYSFRRLMGDRRLPVDYLILSTGTGIIRYGTGDILLTRGMNGADAATACEAMMELDLDFFVQGEFPENHRSWFRSSGRDNPDFFHRLSFYHEWSRDFGGFDPETGRPSQVVAIVPPGKGMGVYLKVLELLEEGFSIVRTTSPLDGESMWIEVFPAGVSKGAAAAWLATELGVEGERTAAVGNDYNDGDLLEWARSSYVVANAPEGLCHGSTGVAANDEGGVAMAVDHWLRSMGAEA